MSKKIAFVIFLSACAFLTQISAQTDVSGEKQAAIKELVSLINNDNKAEELVTIFSSQMEDIREATINLLLDERTDLTREEKKNIRNSLLAEQKEASRRFREKLMQKLDYNNMVNEIVSIVYDKYFTLEEINDLAAFYKTPTGQKTLKVMTPLMTETMKLTQERLLPKIPIILKELQEEEKQQLERQINNRKTKTVKSDTE